MYKKLNIYEKSELQLLSIEVDLANRNSKIWHHIANVIQ